MGARSKLLRYFFCCHTNNNELQIKSNKGTKMKWWNNIKVYKKHMGNKTKKKMLCLTSTSLIITLSITGERGMYICEEE